MTLDERLRSALPSLGLPEDRCGVNRGSQLVGSERDLYRWILRSFASGQHPSLDDITGAASEHGVHDVEGALRHMVEFDLIQRDTAGMITCAYPFSSVPTNHVVTLDNGVRLYSMCAVDALGVPAMLGTGGVISTSDPISGVSISIAIDAEGNTHPDPKEAVVLCAIANGPGPLSSMCCPLVNTFESEADAAAFLEMHPELQGPILTIPDAVACGEAVFRGVLG
jgi:Alkylmercury lyase